MEIFVYILVFLLLIILLIVFIPIQIVLSTRNEMIGLYYGKWFSTGIKLHANEAIFFYKLPCRTKEMDFIAKIASRNTETKNIKQSDKKEKGKSEWSKALLQRSKNRWKEILNAFKIKEMEVNIDTDDYIMNAYLFPVFQYLGYRYNKPLAINFLGINKIELRVKTRIADLIYALVK